MKKTQNNLILCAMVFSISLIISNVVTAKTINLGIPLFGSTITIPGAAVCYAITFLMTDVIGEIWGKKSADRIVIYGMVCQVMATLMIIFTQYIPAVDPNMQAAYDKLLGQNWVFVVGSLIAYLCSQYWDVWVFHKIRSRYIIKYGDTRHKWIWNNVSTMTSQIIDTVLFIGIAFGLGFGWLFDPNMWPTLGAMLVGQYLFKFALAILDTPVFYLLTRKHGRTEL